MIETSDGEVFPVKRKLLRSCIALTSALRSTSETSTTIRVPVDTLTFDRCVLCKVSHALSSTNSLVLLDAVPHACSDQYLISTSIVLP